MSKAAYVIFTALPVVSSSTGAAVTLPIPIPPPEQDDGPHLAYAGQWVLFSACAVGGWIIVVRRRARAAPATERT